jgi:hypothetical protein
MQTCALQRCQHSVFKAQPVRTAQLLLTNPMLPQRPCKDHIWGGVVLDDGTYWCMLRADLTAWQAAGCSKRAC